MRPPIWLLLLAAAPAAAADFIVSSGPDAVEVTIYRNPNRSAGSEIDPDDLNGFALITETRTVDLPRGPVTVRFEGVASGIQPESAILLGAPVAEKNQDRALLSQRGLLDAFTGQRVILRRTDPATGKVSEEAATIRSDPDRVIVQTAAGIESLYCTGLRQTLLFPGVPPTLVAKPTLSVTTGDLPGGRQTLTLAYLAWGFDWQANYVAELSDDARQLDLFGWLTMASGDDTSFVDAPVNAVAGRLERETRDDDGDADARDQGIGFNCWPAGTTSSGIYALPPAPPPPAPIVMQMAARGAVAEELADSDSIVVTGNRIASQEELGDLKLYRLPQPVTVAARSQKQAAFLRKQRVKGAMIYRVDFDNGDSDDDVTRLYRLQNRKADGLGEPLPAGQVALFQTGRFGRQLVGESSAGDKAVDEEVEWELGEASNVTAESEEQDDEGPNWERQRLTVRNANPFPIRFEARFRNGEDNRYDKFSDRLADVKGRKVWALTIPANATRVLDFTEFEVDDPAD